MEPVLASPSIHDTPEAVLEQYIAAAAAREAPVPVESDEGARLYRALSGHVWRRHQRPVCASDIRDLWQRIDTLKRGAAVVYPISGIHFWAADFTNALCADSAGLAPENNQRLAAWLDDWPNVCILGQTGRGKSSTINRLFGIKMAEISHHQACTATVTDYRLVTGTFLNRPTGVVLWDAPGYGDERWPWERYVKLYRRLARKCDVVVFMLDNDRTQQLDHKMFRKLKKRTDLDAKLVVALNKADLFYPGDWDDKAGCPGAAMLETISHRAIMVSEALGLKNPKRVAPMSALKNWNLFTLLTAMVDAAGESKGASLLRAVRPPDDRGTDGAGEKRSGADLGRRFGVGTGLRAHFRSVIS